MSQISDSESYKAEADHREWWVRVDFVERPMLMFDKSNTESLLHAILLAIDAIVAHKPEAFK